MGAASEAGLPVAGWDPAANGIDLADPAFWRRPMAERVAAFARLRQLDGPVFFGEHADGSRRGAAGFYALVHHADIVEASRNAAVFISSPGVTTPEPARWVRAVFGDSMVNLDDPRHAQMRRIVSRAFTPRLLERIQDDIQAVVTRILDDVEQQRPDDFVAAVATRLPFEIICDMMGIPERHRPPVLAQVNHATEDIGVDRGRRRLLRVPGKNLRALLRLHRVVAEIGRERRKRPEDDLISALVAGEADGRLSSRELGAFFSLLLVAGVETTRNAIAHGLALLTEHQDQRALLAADPGRHAAGAVEEIVRHATPIIQFRRTLAADHVLNGTQLRRGDKVVLFFASANRDERVFTDPDAFDITRDPNPHLGFGGGGPHFCLGAHLARQEMAVLLREMYTRMPAIRAVGDADLVPSTFDNRVRSLPFAVAPPGT